MPPGKEVQDARSRPRSPIIGGSERLLELFWSPQRVFASGVMLAGGPL